MATANDTLSPNLTGSPSIICDCGPFRAALPAFHLLYLPQFPPSFNQPLKFLHNSIYYYSKSSKLFEVIMESMKMKLFAAVIVMSMAVSNVAAQVAPAPAPASDATVFVPTVVASVVALSFGFLFWAALIWFLKHYSV